MKLQDFLAQRQLRAASAPRFRQLCEQCLQPDFSCYCNSIEAFDPGIQFVILIHPIELRRRIATGRMSHLSLQNSKLIMGQDYSQNAQVNALVQDPTLQPLILYPGPQSTNLTPLSGLERRGLLKTGLRPVIFVIDGTWATARKMMRLSDNLQTLPRLCFTPEKPSNFRVRKQPKPGCYSTIEAIHAVIDLFGPRPGFDFAQRPHDALLRVFDQMVERQLEFIRRSQAQPELCTYRRPQNKPRSARQLDLA